VAAGTTSSLTVTRTWYTAALVVLRLIWNWPGVSGVTVAMFVAGCIRTIALGGHVDVNLC